MVKSRPVVLVFAVVLSAPLVRAVETRDVSPAPLSGPSADLKLDTYQQVAGWLRDFELRKIDIAELQEHLSPWEPELREALKSTMAIQRSLSVRALAFAVDRSSAVESLKLVLTADVEESVRAESAASLGALKDASAVESLIAALRDEAAVVREAAVLALGKFNDERAGAPLLERLRYDTVHTVRMAAARTLPLLPIEKLQEEIAAILDTEKDERVRWMLSETLRLLRGEAEDEDAGPTPDAFATKLKELATDMQSVESKLRDDRHDSSVQNDQQDVQIKLAEMIKTLEDLEQSKTQQAQNSKDGKKRWGALASSSSPSPSKGSKLSMPPRDPAQEAAFQAARVAEQRNRWANLPAASRDEMLQVFRPEVPIRWRKRLEAYFLSVAAEEVKKK